VNNATSWLTVATVDVTAFATAPTVAVIDDVTEATEDSSPDTRLAWVALATVVLTRFVELRLYLSNTVDSCVPVICADRDPAALVLEEAALELFENDVSENGVDVATLPACNVARGSEIAVDVVDAVLTFVLLNAPARAEFTPLARLVTSAENALVTEAIAEVRLPTTTDSTDATLLIAELTTEVAAVTAPVTAVDTPTTDFATAFWAVATPLAPEDAKADVVAVESRKAIIPSPSNDYLDLWSKD
jgi:hypothetical protein